MNEANVQCLKYGPSTPIIHKSQFRCTVQDMKSIQPSRCTNKLITLEEATETSLNESSFYKNKQYMCSLLSFMVQEIMQIDVTLEQTTQVLNEWIRPLK